MPLASRFPAPGIPDVSLPTFFREQVALFGDRVALIDGPTGRSVTYAQLLSLSASVSNALLARGLKHQDRVAFIVPNLPEVSLAYHGVVGAGGVAMMVNPLSTVQELEKYFKLGTPRFVVTVPPFVDTIRQVAPSIPIFVIGGATQANVEPLSALLTESTVPPKVHFDPMNDLAVMPFSSGTTGFPKGVMLTHRNLIAQCLALRAYDETKIATVGQHIIAVLPFFHIYGITAFLTFGLLQGAIVVTLPRFDMPQYLALVAKYQPPILHVVPPILLGLAKFPGTLELPGAQAALVGAAPLSESLAVEFTRRTGITVTQVYGMTEVTGGSHLGSSTPERNRPGSIGELLPSFEAQIVEGEIWVRGPSVMKGYYGDPAATAATIDPDGWLHTGDIGRADDHGDFYLTDRLKELIKYKGLQVSPAELEAVLLSHEDVADAAVYAIPDEEAGELPKAAVVLKPGRTNDAATLMQYVAGRVAPQKRIRALRFVDQIPKSASGKILRSMLIAQEQQPKP